MRLLLSASACLVPLLVGCTTGTIPEQLEALAVSDGLATYDEATYSGTATVTGSGRDFEVALDNDGAENPHTVLTLHTPGLSDLSTLSGRAFTALLHPQGLHEERSILLSDESGPVYLADDGDDAWRFSEFLGADFVTWGDVVGTSRDSQYTWEYTSARFQTDEGAIDVFPGETTNITLGGARYRAAVLGAYQVTPLPNASLPCGGISDFLSYELLRVETDTAAEVLERPADMEIGHLGCM